MGSFISKGMSGAMEKMQEQQQTMVKYMLGDYIFKQK